MKKYDYLLYVTVGIIIWQHKLEAEIAQYKYNIGSSNIVALLKCFKPTTVEGCSM